MHSNLRLAWLVAGLLCIICIAGNQIGATMGKVMQVVIVGLFALISSSSITVFAAELNFNVSGAGVDSYALPNGVIDGTVYATWASWTQLSSPVPLSYVVGNYTEIAVTGYFESLTYDASFGPEGPISDVIFYHQSNKDAGGFTIIGPSLMITYFSRDQLYSGPESDPRFRSINLFYTDISSYIVEGPGYECYYCGGAVGSAIAVPTPEPATWASMIFGLGVIGGLVRRRFNRLRKKGFHFRAIGNSGSSAGLVLGMAMRGSDVRTKRWFCI